ncbi:hypothetical protein HYS54_03845 [Candidatus Micrarchaeota archaeon]|nr:hypothetical protein [Candidatus Micrarchaeota archaeon]
MDGKKDTRQVREAMALVERAKRLSAGYKPLVILLLLAFGFAFYSQWQLIQSKGATEGYSASFLADLSNASFNMISLVHSDQCSATHGKLKIQAFYEPFCESCSEQARMIESITSVYSTKIEVEKVCTAFNSDSSYLICSKSFTDGASYEEALSFVCAQNGTTDASCVSTIVGRSCADLGISSNCTTEQMRSKVRERQQDLGYSVLAPASTKLADSYTEPGEINLPAPTLVFNCAFKREGMFSSKILEKSTLTDMVDVFVRRL